VALPDQRLTPFGLAPLIGLLIAIGWSVGRPPSLDSTARLADRRLGLREQLGTALELVQRGDRRPMALAQVQRANVLVAHAQRGWPREPARDVRTLCACAAAALAIVALVGMSEPLLQGLPRISVIARSPSVARDNDSDAQLAPPAVSAGRLADLLNTLERQRREAALEPGERDRLADFERELADTTAKARGTQRALDRLADALQQISAGRDVAEAVQRGRFAEAAAGLEAIGRNSDHLTIQARAQLAAALRQAAELTRESPELAEREQRAADALAGADYEATDKALDDLAQALLRAGGSMLSEEDLAAAWERLREARRDAPSTTLNPPSSTDAQRTSIGEASGSARAGMGVQPPGPRQGGQGIGQGLGDGQPDPTAGRLEAVGVPVEVPLRPGLGSAPPGQPQDLSSHPTTRLTELVSTAQPQPASHTAPRPLRAETRDLPLDARPLIRAYFTSDGNGP
jgi:hypothetical protein